MDQSGWTDCRHIEEASWFGRPPPLRSVDTPLSVPKSQYSATFATDFNGTGPKAIERAVTEKKIPSAEPHHVSPYLFYCEGIRPAAISQYFFLKPSEAQTLFYYYFSAANIDYLALPDALRLLLSRVAYPEDRQSLFAIFCAFSDVYCESNQFISETRDEIRKLAIASVVVSMSKRKANADCLPQPRFMALVEQVRCPDEYKVFLYESLREKPIVLFFTALHFQNDPETVKKGVLTSTGGLFKKKKLFCVLSDPSLKVYKDQQCSDQSEEIPLYNVTVRFLPAKDKEPAKVVIASKDGLPLGSSFQKGVRRPAKKALYEFSGSKDDTELRMWVDNLNFCAFYINLVQMTNCSPKSQ
jgi:hypothetical protein